MIDITMTVDDDREASVILDNMTLVENSLRNALGHLGIELDNITVEESS